MTFENLRIDQLKTVIRYRAECTEWRVADRRDHIIGINISGTTWHDLGYKRLDLGPDHIYFFNRRDDYTARVVENGYCYSIHFTTSVPIDTDSFCKKVNNTEELVRMIKRVEQAWLQREDGELRMLSEFYAFCHTLHALYNAPYTPQDRRAATAKEYMDLHFRERDCLARTVEMIDLSQRRFNDLFKLRFGITPNAYLVTRRVEYAAELLSLGYLPIADIAELAGFSDVYYFSKTFKQYKGQTPGGYRKSAAAPTP